MNAHLHLHLHFFKYASSQQYEPEIFPGLIYRMREPKTVLLIFFSGKVILIRNKVVDHLNSETLANWNCDELKFKCDDCLLNLHNISVYIVMFVVESRHFKSISADISSPVRIQEGSITAINTTIYFLKWFDFLFNF